MKDFKTRSEAFNKELVALQKKHKVAIYAANVVINKNAEVVPMVRLADMVKADDSMVLPSD